MKRLYLIIAVLMFCFLSTGCDKRDDKDYFIYSSQYINVTEQYTISTFNGYKFVGIEEIDDDGTYTIIFKISKINRTLSDKKESED